jgi:hypothetical protein
MKLNLQSRKTIQYVKKVKKKRNNPDHYTTMGEHKLIVHRDKLITENTFVDIRYNYIFGIEGQQSQMRYSISLL